jgi:hypothetical protein
MRTWRSTMMLILLLGCAREEAPEPMTPSVQPAPSPATAQPSTTTSGTPGGASKTAPNLPVGSACTLADGYVPQFPPCPPPPAGTPGTCPPPNRQQYPGYSDLPPGIGYCLTGSQFPHGYFTMNCAQDSDCPGASVCDNVCWRPCTSDDQCTQPTTCLRPPINPHPRFVRYCTCIDCIPRDTF